MSSLVTKLEHLSCDGVMGTEICTQVEISRYVVLRPDLNQPCDNIDGHRNDRGVKEKRQHSMQQRQPSNLTSSH